MIKSEDARLNDWFYFDIQGRDWGSYVVAAQRVVARTREVAARLFHQLGPGIEYLFKRRRAAALHIVPLTPDELIFSAALPQFPQHDRGAHGDGRRCRWRWSAASGCSSRWIIISRSRPAWASSPWPASPPSLAW